MEAVARKESKEARIQRTELFRELDKGIHDMEKGNIIPHDEAMKMIRKELELLDV